MKNLKLTIGIGVMVLGVIALAFGIFLRVAIPYTIAHPLRAYAVIGVGVVLIIAGIISMMFGKSRVNVDRG